MEDTTELLEPVKVDNIPPLPKEALKAIEEKLKISPKRIEDIDEYISEESMGGNADSETIGVNAIYMAAKDGKEFIFTNHNEQYGRETSDVSFRISNPDVRSAMERFMKTGVMVPALIDEVYTRKGLSEEYDEYFKRRAMEHNAYWIKPYLEKGGDVKELPPSHLLPDLEELMKPQEAGLGADQKDLSA